MKITTISVLPQIFAALSEGIVGRALSNELLTLSHLALRDYSDNKHRNIDDTPYGGGPGMVITAPVVDRALNASNQQHTQPAKVIYLSPKGAPLTQEKVKSLAKEPALTLLCGRYEGIDQRIIDSRVDECISIGDYVVSGGELPACLLIDAITRWLPGALSDEASKEQDSFNNKRLDHPHYTRPEDFSGQKVPNVLLSGNHKTIARWRAKQALGMTWLYRPDLLECAPLSALETELLAEFKRERE